MKTLRERFEDRVVRRDGCWDWRGKQSDQGYSQMRVGPKTTGAHRVAYELFVGPIPVDKEMDHLCRNRGCVNPAHLEAVAHRVNVLRGDAPTARHARATHCVHGHPLSGDNVRAYRGGRTCRTCERDQGLAKLARRPKALPRTMCPRGHAYTPENTYLYRESRRCRTCRAAQDRKRKPSPASRAYRREYMRTWRRKTAA